ncbi:MmgE/PrpD family protein [Aquibium carbonis]|uniref:MmgE/PrpD family protein n=1 Tax=Aquibium carbonis TaxID=2495581 RepID=A0A429YXE1_9HYPH|nr:MmgE/PrpD family protein [Aquibium carbonis]RST86110.1 MmgE/PrpD family protein [Aquibium carbonis]
MTDPFPRLVEHVSSLRHGTLPASAVTRMKVFILDTLGVGAAGAHGTNLEAMTALVDTWGHGADARVWGSETRLPAPSAAFVNAYRIHSLEFDCLHERAVLHPMAAILAAVLAYADRRAHRGRPVAGAEMIAACIAGVDIATFLGFAARGPVRFFRPSTAGGFGAAAAIANLAGYDFDLTANTLGIQYSQTSGTMQAHVEGSPCLGLQVGFASRAGIVSADLAAAGFTGPRDVLTGPHGYFRLFEADRFEIDGEIERIGHEFQIEEMAHKPFPSGRLTHGAVHALKLLRDRLRFSADDVRAFECFVPSLVARLVGRPDIPDPEPNYAKLCIPFVAATYLRRGDVNVDGFLGRDVLGDPITHAIASRVVVIQDDNPDPNAMTPQRFKLTLSDGSVHEIKLDHVLGHPKAALSRDQHLDKFRKAWKSGGLEVEAGERLIDRVDDLESVADVSVLSAMLARS